MTTQLTDKAEHVIELAGIRGTLYWTDKESLNKGFLNWHDVDRERTSTEDVPVVTMSAVVNDNCGQWGLIEIANGRYLDANHREDESLTYLRWSDGSEYVLIITSDTDEELLDIAISLFDYPVISDMTLGEVEWGVKKEEYDDLVGRFLNEYDDLTTSDRLDIIEALGNDDLLWDDIDPYGEGIDAEVLGERIRAYREEIYIARAHEQATAQIAGQGRLF